MKKILFRIALFIIPVGMGTIIFSLFVLAGNKSKGPLEDMGNFLSAGVARLEKKVTHNPRQSRAASLNWFMRYWGHPVLMNWPDSIYLGAYDPNTVESYEDIVSLEDSLHTRFPIISIYTAWGSKNEQVFPLLRTQAIVDLGSVPMITWEPWLDDFVVDGMPGATKSADKNKGGLKAIAAGKFDAYVEKWAMDAKKLGAPFFLRFGHEMNDPYRYPWGPQNNKPADYIAAWKHLVDLFKRVGATNAIWIWSPHPAYVTYTDFYPGNDYVDWIGITALNYGTIAPWSRWWSLNETIERCYTDLSPFQKPMMLTEFGSLQVGGSRAEWYKDGLQSLPKKFPAVKAVVFYHADNDNTTSYKTLDWSFINDKEVIEAIRQSTGSWRK